MQSIRILCSWFRKKKRKSGKVSLQLLGSAIITSALRKTRLVIKSMTHTGLQRSGWVWVWVWGVGGGRLVVGKVCVLVRIALSSDDDLYLSLVASESKESYCKTSYNKKKQKSKCKKQNVKSKM